MTNSSGTTGDPIRDYVRANLHAMTREAIRERLIAAGHDPKRVDEIWEQEWTAVTPPSTESALWTTSLVLLVVGGLIGGGAATLLASFMSSEGGTATKFFVLYAILYVGLGLVIAWVVRWAARGLRISGGWALAIGIVLVPIYGGLMYGTCLAAASITHAG